MGAHPLGPLHPLLARVARHARRLDRHNHLRTKGKYLPSFFCAKLPLKITLYVRPYVRPILHLTYDRIFRCSTLVPPSIAFIIDF